MLTICGSEVNVILAIVGDTVCDAAGSTILVLDGHLAGVVEDRGTVNGTAIFALADQLYAGSIIHSQIAVYCKIFTGNTQFTGAGDICISENRFSLSAGKDHILCGFNDQLTLEHRVCATIQINGCIRSVDGQISDIGIDIRIAFVQAQGFGGRVVAQSTVAKNISAVFTGDFYTVDIDAILLFVMVSYLAVVIFVSNRTYQQAAGIYFSGSYPLSANISLFQGNITTIYFQAADYSRRSILISTASTNDGNFAAVNNNIASSGVFSATDAAAIQAAFSSDRPAVYGDIVSAFIIISTDAGCFAPANNMQ